MSESVDQSPPPYAGPSAHLAPADGALKRQALPHAEAHAADAAPAIVEQHPQRHVPLLQRRRQRAPPAGGGGRAPLKTAVAECWSGEGGYKEREPGSLKRPMNRGRENEEEGDGERQ